MKGKKEILDAMSDEYIARLERRYPGWSIEEIINYEEFTRMHDVKRYCPKVRRMVVYSDCLMCEYSIVSMDLSMRPVCTFPVHDEDRFE